jgi:hypothetical protein
MFLTVSRKQVFPQALFAGRFLDFCEKSGASRQFLPQK